MTNFLFQTRKGAHIARASAEIGNAEEYKVGVNIMIGEIKDNASIAQQQPAGAKAKSNKTGKPSVQADSAQAADTVELGSQRAASATYTRTMRKLSASDLATIKSAQAQALENLRKLVEQVLAGQSGAAKKASGVGSSDLDAVARAKQAISEDGDFGVKAVSDRIVQFAIAVSGGDTSKYEQLKAAIDKGFQQATHSLGGKLPDICQQTYDETMKKLEAWKNGNDSNPTLKA